jgi:uncharacterized Zn finger protein
MCEGSESPFYRVRAELDEGGVRSASCTCPYDYGGHCKHVIALLLSYAHKPDRFAVRKEPTELLSDLSREQLIALLTKLVSEQPDLYELIEAALVAPSVSSAAARSQRSRGLTDNWGDSQLRWIGIRRYRPSAVRASAR